MSEQQKINGYWKVYFSFLLGFMLLTLLPSIAILKRKGIRLFSEKGEIYMLLISDKNSYESEKIENILEWAIYPNSTVLDKKISEDEVRIELRSKDEDMNIYEYYSERIREEFSGNYSTARRFGEKITIVAEREGFKFSVNIQDSRVKITINGYCKN